MDNNNNTENLSSSYTKSYTQSESNSVLSRLYRLILAEIIACFNVPTADPSLQKSYKARQYHAVVQQLPLSSAGNMITSLVLMLSFWQELDSVILLSWFTLLWSIGLINIFLWWNLRFEDKNKPLKKFAAEWLVLDLAAAAALHVGMAAYLFGITNEQGRLLLTAVIAAFVSTGSWMFSFLPSAGLAWLLIFCGGTIVALPHMYAGNYAYLILLVAFFALILSATVLICSRMFLSNLEAETKIENQRQVMGLLLNDFEENASDWLWETDEYERLQHASVRLVQIMNTTELKLDGLELTSIISSLIKSNDGLDALTLFSKKLQAKKAFKKVIIPINLHNKNKWWAFTAKPLVDIHGKFIGWRGVGSDVTDAVLREMQMTHLANTDTLTNLANRYQFNRFLKLLFSAENHQPSCTMLLLDLDNFKMVNDSLGHAVGDKLLQEVAIRLQTILKPQGMLARLGGDEFAIVHPERLRSDDAHHYADKILAILMLPWEAAEHRIEIHCSIGIACAPTDAQSSDDLFKFCDMALYAAKAAGKGSFCFFDVEMETLAQQKLALLSDMKQGLLNKEFLLYYQPQVNFKTGLIAGFEALARWDHPKKGMISPVDFIPLAEESGFINELGQFILEQACKDAVTWPKHLNIAVNVSALQFASTNLLKVVNDALERYKLAPERLEIELTESVMITDTEHVVATLNNLRKTGVRVALDDFGTGYSSLSYLQQIPMDKLKIDRSFVCQLDAKNNEQAISMLKCIVALAEAFNFETTVEGIEDDQQMAIFQALNTTYGQGFYFARPADAKATLSLIKHWKKT